MNAHQLQKDGILYSCDRSRLQLEVIHRYLTRSYWSEGISRDLVEAAVANSVPFGAYCDDAQIGFARVVTDSATFAWLCDVFVLEDYRNRGVAKRLVEHVVSHPQLRQLRNLLLATRDAHSLYARFGFSPLARPENFMAISRPGLYLRKAT